MPRRVSVKQFGSPEDALAIESFNPDEEFKLLPNQVLVKVAAIGINPVETYIRAGLYDPLPSLPYTPGANAGGVVQSVGPEVGSEIYVGARVWLTGSVSGTYSDICICAAEDVHILPDQYSFSQGAALGIPYRTAYRAMVSIGGVKCGESVLIHGATGGVGIACIQFAKSMGLSPIIASTSKADDPETVSYLLENGAHKVVAHGECHELVDLIVENLANANLGKDLKILKRNGRVVIVGSRGDVTISPRDLMRCEGHLLGMVGPGSAQDRKSADLAIQEGLRTGAINPVVGVSFEFNQIAKAHVEVMQHASGTKGKIVVTTGAVF